MAPAQRWREPDVVELGEGDEEVRGEAAVGGRPVLVRGIDLASEVVDGVIAAPHDAVVLGQAVVVKLVGAVADSLPVPPSDAVQLPSVSGSVAST